MPEQNPDYLLILANIIGVILGAGITAFINWLSISKETKLRVQEKVFDKRIEAHEEILRLSQLLRTTASTQTVDEEGNVISYPAFAHDDENFENLQWEFYQAVNFNSHWLNIEVFRELNFIQDYLENLKIYLKEKKEEEYPKIAAKIKPDFIDIASSLEKITLKFFKKDIYKINLKPTEGHHKYQIEETKKRLNETELLKLINKSE